MLWLVYDRIEFDVLGLGATAEEARRDALERSNLLPSDFNAESWEQHDVSSDYWGPENWVTATQERYREAMAAK